MLRRACSGACATSRGATLGSACSSHTVHGAGALATTEGSGSPLAAAVAGWARAPPHADSATETSAGKADAKKTPWARDMGLGSAVKAARRESARYEGPVELVLVRHAETVWNAEGRWQGQTDVPLSEKGRAEVRAASARFFGARFDRIVSSDLSRALDTASGIASGLEDPPTVERDSALREMNLGRWCGLLHSEVEAKFSGELASLQAGTFEEGSDRRIGIDGETLSELAARVDDALGRVIGSARDTDRVLLVTHGGVIRAVLMAMLRLEGTRRPLLGARNTAITTIDVMHGVRQLRSYNDARHLGREAEGSHEEIVGPGGRAHVIELLELSLEAPLALPPEHATTVVSRKHRQLVAFAVPA